MPLWDTEIWLNSPTSREALRAAFAEACKGKTVRQEMELDAGEGRHAIVDFSLTPIMDTEGRVVQLLAEGRDITASRQAEDQLREVESLSTMGRLAARVAHEINNPLAGIQNSFLLIKDAVPEDHPHHSYVGAIEREIGRIAGVTRQLYETYRPDTDGARETSIPNLVGDAVALLGQVNRDSRVTIKVDLQRAPHVVQLPDALLRQAVYNLVQNAVEASPKGERFGSPRRQRMASSSCGSKTTDPASRRRFESEFSSRFHDQAIQHQDGWHGSRSLAGPPLGPRAGRSGRNY